MRSLASLSSARRGFIVIAGATGLAQAIGLAGTPVISRLFPPGEFGLFAAVNAAALPAAALASLRFEMAVAVPDDERRARALVSIGLRASASFAVVGVALAALLGVLAPHVWSGHVSLLLWVPLVGGLIGAFAVLNQLAVREREYAAIAQRNVLMALSVVGLQVLAGVLGAGPHGLAAGLAGGQAVGVASLLHGLRAHLQSPRVTRPERRSTWREFRMFPLVMAPSGVINVFGLSAPIILAASLYGEAVSGWLGMTQRVLTVPVALVGMALAQVYVGEFARTKRAATAGLERLFLRTSLRLALAALVITAIVAVASRFAFPLVLGDTWTRSGVYATVLAVAMGAQLCVSPLSQTIVVLGRPGLQAAWDVLRLMACGGAIVVGHARGWDDVQTVGLLSVMMVLTYAVGWLLAWWSVRRGPTGVSSRAVAAPL
jgi:O-antigen/teichoic acid export membrane protein